MAELEKYEVLEKIGHGSFGIIRKVKRKSDGYVLCRKEISYLQMSHKERGQLQAELQILKGLRHPNIVAYYEREHMKISSDLHIYMEYCEHGDLGRYIKDLKKDNKMADEDFVWSVFTQLVMALYRCHHGDDPPQVGRNVMGLSSDAKPLRKTNHAMILHRDLKPENIFLGSDASVKLGDFGLSKILQSHDFASTYVGTPFYMSPEICAGEQYSLHSDIWAFGCIMYELSSKEPPFNAKTHMELIQRIRLGKVTPLSHIYSNELKESISKCLKVNSMNRPDTAQLLNIPMVKLKRKELEVVRLGKQMKVREEQATQALKEAEKRLVQFDVDQQATRAELDNILRREWEVKARLEIDRQVQQTRDELREQFEVEVTRRVADTLKAQPQHQSQQFQMTQGDQSLEEQIPRSTTPNPELLPGDLQPTSHYQSQSTTGETDDFPSSTDLSELSLESPAPERSKQSKRNGRAPLARAQTMFDGSPADVNMADPSPAPIHSLNLSPRRDQDQPIPRSNKLFGPAASSSTIGSDADDDDDDDDEVPALPSPTRAKNSGGDPFKQLGPSSKRPGLVRQRTAPQNKAQSGNLFAPNARLTKDRSQPNLTTGPLLSKPPNQSTSPKRRMSKLPSASCIDGEAISPPRRTEGQVSPQRQLPSRKNDPADMRHTAALNSHVQGRTLIELAQARTLVSGISTHDFAEGSPDEIKVTDSFDKEANSLGVTVWDPERDEMPSPFLAKKGRGVLPGTIGGPGLRHLR